jgi:hypothetical protein
MPLQQPKRRWLRFSLRALLVFVLLLSVPLGWFAWRIQKAGKQREAVAAILEAGGRVGYDYELTDQGAWKRVAEPATPHWLLKLLGYDFFFDVAFADCHCTELGDDFACLNRLTELKTLSLCAAGIGDNDLMHLREMSKLERLRLSRTQISDVSLQHLAGLTRLTKLYLDDTQISDAGLEHLKGLTNLAVLDLEDTQVTSDGVKKLREALPNCEIRYSRYVMSH